MRSIDAMSMTTEANINVGYQVHLLPHTHTHIFYEHIHTHLHTTADIRYANVVVVVTVSCTGCWGTGRVRYMVASKEEATCRHSGRGHATRLSSWPWKRRDTTE